MTRAATGRRGAAEGEASARRGLSLAFGAFALVCAATALSGATGQAVAQDVAPNKAAPAKAAKGKAGKAAADGQAPKVDTAAAEKALEAGIKHYQAGKLEAAVQSLNAALQGGGLPSARMARGLYYRGLAYKAQGKPAQSISDLTSALWLKGGLDDKERADAQAQRVAAYHEAGLGEPPSINLPTRAATSTPAAGTSAQQVASSASSASSGGVSGALSGVTGFFGNLWGGGGSPAPDAVGASKAATATGSVQVPAPPQAAAPEVSSWSSETQSAKARPAAAPAPPPARAAPVRTAAVSPPAATVVAAPVAAKPAEAAAPAAGKFKLQVAAVRTRAEADAIAVRLKKEFGKKLASREPVVDEAAFGNMGTFYRVRVGPYADANEPRRLCVSLRASNGFDCMVVTQ